MGTDFQKCLPFYLLPAKKSIYLFDAWPDQQNEIIRFVTTFSIDHVFVSSSQATKNLNSTKSKTVYHWIPEGINPADYKYVSYKEKNIDVLSIGRKFEAYHESIEASLAKSGHIYLYEKIKGELIFPSRQEFIDGLAHSKISICVPSNITHPERSRDIETMTIRYLQSMASKCIIVGYAPKEMISLFGYNPIIEIDMKDPVSQLYNVINNFMDYVPLIEKNYSVVFEHHTWKNRFSRIKQILDEGI